MVHECFNFLWINASCTGASRLFVTLLCKDGFFGRFFRDNFSSGIKTSRKMNSPFSANVQQFLTLCTLEAESRVERREALLSLIICRLTVIQDFRWEKFNFGLVICYWKVLRWNQKMLSTHIFGQLTINAIWRHIRNVVQRHTLTFLTIFNDVYSTPVHSSSSFISLISHHSISSASYIRKHPWARLSSISTSEAWLILRHANVSLSTPSFLVAR